MTVNSNGTLIINNHVSTYGNLNILSGTLQNNSSGETGTSTDLGTGTITLGSGSNNATLLLNESNGSTYTNAISVNGTGVNTILATNWTPTFSGSVTLNNSNLMLITNDNNQGILSFNGGIGGTGNVTLQVNDNKSTSQVNIGAGGINNVGTITNNGTGTAGQTLTISGTIGSNVTGVIQNSANTQLWLTDSTSNTFSGGVTIKSGTVLLHQSTSGINALGSGTVTLGDVANTGAAATLTYNNTSGSNGNSPTYTNAINVVGTGINTISTTAWNSTYSGTVTLNNANLTLIAANTGSGSSNEVINGAITGTGNLILQVNDINSASYLQIGSANNAGTITSNGTGTAGQSVNITGTIGANVTAVIQNGPNTKLNLSGTNSYTGDTTLLAGTLNLSNANAAQFSVVNVNGGVLTFAQNSTTVGGLAGSGNVNLINGANGVALTVGNSNVSNGSGTNPNTLNPVFAGALENSAGTASVIKVGSNTQTFSGANTYNGGTTISAGTLQFAQTNAMPASGAVAVSSGATLAVNAGGTGEFTDGNNTTNGTVESLFNNKGGQGAGVTLASGSAVGIDTTNASGGLFNLTGSVAGAGVGLTKLGTGTLQISGTANTYTGPTLINAGTLNVTGGLGSTAVTVTNGATLTGAGNNTAGNGIIGGGVTVNGGGMIALAGGSSASILTVGGLTLGMTGAYATNHATLNFTVGGGGTAELIDVGTAGQGTSSTGVADVEFGWRLHLIQPRCSDSEYDNHPAEFWQPDKFGWWFLLPQPHGHERGDQFCSWPGHLYPDR